MKHLLYTLLGILLLAGCKEDKYNVIIPMSDIYLSAPQDGAKIDLNDLSIDEYSFSWDKALEKGAKLILCRSVFLSVGNKGRSRSAVVLDC